MTRNEVETHPASFRDPSGFLFRRDGILYRQVNRTYRQQYEAIQAAGLFDELIDDGLLIPHREANVKPVEAETAHVILQPEKVPFVSYPYEWCFDQLKDAALHTLEIQSRAVSRGFTLKDASAYNIQFRGGAPILIDSLSFEERVEGEPWVAYRQFCQHFLAPLALMASRDIRLGELLRVHIDGIPLDLTSELLPLRSYLRFGQLVHLHLHASAQRRFAGREIGGGEGKRAMGQRSLEGLIESLRGAINALRWEPAGSWTDYYDFHNYGGESFEAKKEIVASCIDEISPKRVLDLGANTGLFSRLATGQGALCVSADFDPGAVQHNYRQAKSAGETNLHPLLLDLTNPSPDQGWAGQERQSLAVRGPFDLVMALALIHHLAISNNLPFPSVAEYLSRLGDALLIEFVPKSDPQVQKLLASRRDIFTDYGRDAFEASFEGAFRIRRREPVPGTERVLYLMERRPG